MRSQTGAKMAKHGQLGGCLQRKPPLAKTHRPQASPLQSVLEEPQVEEYVNFCNANDSNIVIRRNRDQHQQSLPGLAPDSEFFMSMPRKPDWQGMERDPDGYQREEEAVFFKWRAQLASLEHSNSHLIMTPFERSLGIWRELWKAVEKADLLVQVLDSRNPRAFYSPDLFKYASDVRPHCRHLLILNKADLLSGQQRGAWHAYFDSIGVDHTFFSNVEHSGEASEVPILSSAELLSKIASTLHGKQGVASFVGYPNVGKSSTINSILGFSKAGVSSTPGKTKNIQTFECDTLTVCDCPGLVFPNLASSKGELLLNGILSIDNMKEYLPPVQLLSERVPLEHIEALYNIKITLEHQVSVAESILSAYATSRGMSTSNFGNPDMARAARIVLKDYTLGKLLYCYPPPGMADDEFNPHIPRPMNVQCHGPFLEDDIIAPKATAEFGVKSKKVVSSTTGKKHYKMNKRR